MRRDEIPTPALLLDLDRFEKNLARMAIHARAAGKAIRPHAKTHRCPEIARRQIGAGALGVACAKLGEAEVMAKAGIRGLLCTTPIVPAPKIRRFVELIREAPDTMIVVDNAENVADLDSSLGVGRPHRGRPGRYRCRHPAYRHSAGGARARAGPASHGCPRAALARTPGLRGSLCPRCRLEGTTRRLARSACPAHANASPPGALGSARGHRGGRVYRHLRHRQ